MNLIGLDRPDVDEDELREWASHVREFAAGLQDAQDGTHGMVQGLGGAYRGASYEALVERWGACLHGST